MYICVLLIVLLLISAFFLTMFHAAIRRIHKKNTLKLLKSFGSRFFYRYIPYSFFPQHEYESIYFSLIATQNVIRFALALSVVTPLIYLGFYYEPILEATPFWELWFILGGVVLLGLIFIICDYWPRIIGSKNPEKALSISAPVASLWMTLLFPLTYVLSGVIRLFTKSDLFEHLHDPSGQAKQELIEIIQEADMEENALNKQDKKLIESVFKFREHLAREVMVPRVDVFGVSAQTSIKDAAAALNAEGYSRVPVYKGNIDNIVGILMYKDVLKQFMEYEKNQNNSAILDASVETIMKAPLYTPETKRISNLLQEFRKKQVHMAIVVDEYGGTEGIVTIEDILEQIVGEIADEYDDEEEISYTQTEGGWIVDARMSILDAEEQLGIRIPQDGDYDSIGGYIFHYAGAIPSRGFVIHTDEFEMVVLKSSDKSVDKVRIKPISTTESTIEE